MVNIPKSNMSLPTISNNEIKESYDNNNILENNNILDESLYMEKLNNFYRSISMMELQLQNKHLFSSLRALLYKKYSNISYQKLIIFLHQNDIRGYDNVLLINSIATYNVNLSARYKVVKFNPLEYCVKHKYINYITVLCKYKISNDLYISCTNYLNSKCIMDCLNSDIELIYDNKCDLCNIKAILYHNIFIFSDT